MTDDTLTITQMEEEDILPITEVENQCFSDNWHEADFRRELQNPKIAFYLTAKCGNKVIGYMGTWIILEEAHVIKVGVNPDFRGRKIASTLMLCFLREAVKKGVHWSTLEVSEHNEHAIKLYEKFGYKTVSIRKEYYGTDDNALLMWVGNIHKVEYSEKLDTIEKEIIGEGQ